MAAKRRRSFELTIPSRIEQMEAVHALIEEAVKEYKLNNDMAHWIELSISESMINAIAPSIPERPPSSGGTIYSSMR